jgi:hypothetical protein
VGHGWSELGTVKVAHALLDPPPVVLPPVVLPPVVLPSPVVLLLVVLVEPHLVKLKLKNMATMSRSDKVAPERNFLCVRDINSPGKKLFGEGGAHRYYIKKCRT